MYAVNLCGKTAFGIQPYVWQNMLTEYMRGLYQRLVIILQYKLQP
jgi:hypothetical protein